MGSGLTPSGISYPAGSDAFDPAGDMAALAGDSDTMVVLVFPDLTTANSWATANPGSATAGRLAVIGSGTDVYVRTASAWSRAVPMIQKGTTLCTPTAANTVIGVNVTFATAFASAPTVVCTPSTTANAQAFAYPAGVTTTGFQIVFRRDAVTATNVNWIAIG